MQSILDRYRTRSIAQLTELRAIFYRKRPYLAAPAGPDLHFFFPVWMQGGATAAKRPNNGVPRTSCPIPTHASGLISLRLQSDTSDVSARSTSPTHPASHPCSLMQSFACHHGLSDAVAGHVSDCELSQLIFAHREAFLSCPSAHAGCSAGFGVLASLLEKFAQPTDGGSGMDVVRMLRTEAWLLSGLSA
ncbi:hypothetical protein EDB92DRAFT_1861317 [Lactarius akahatsu]|uniref:Uncharacterized protein n=1 Tax=Lactarius akahatsu TaxID=416441 RepID=A0AAD4LHJ3_9AGAM|nr:hypothetical protein EDB92DRAFT_1861317 [Lactarius akahatsu]